MVWILLTLIGVAVLIHLSTRGKNASQKLAETLEEGRQKAEEFERTYQAIHGHPPATNPYRQ